MISATQRRIVQVLYYLVKRNTFCESTKVNLMKMVYLADRYHLRTYGRSVTESSYAAYERGPVAVDVLSVYDDEEFFAEYMCKYLIVKKNDDGRTIFSVGEDPGMDELSESDIQALDASLAKAKSVYAEEHDLVAFTHRFPEWRIKAVGGRISLGNGIPMDVKDFFLPVEEASCEYCPADDELLAMNCERIGEE